MTERIFSQSSPKRFEQLQQRRIRGMEPLRILRLVSCIFVFVFCTLASNAQVKECTEAEQREIISAHSRDWKAFHVAFKRLAHCDDGAMAESFSDNVVRLLARDWKHIEDLGTLIASDRSFRRFVLNHIDSTTNPADLKMVISNSREHCPATARPLCRSIETEAKSALREQAGFSK